MKIYVYPSDTHGCGHYRLIWPARELIRRGHDVQLVMPKERNNLHAEINPAGEVERVTIPDDADVIVVQRVSHKYLADSIPLIRKQGVAVVVDVDDDLSSINPANPAFLALHPRTGKSDTVEGQHNWLHTLRACDNATLVTTSSVRLTARYARHGRFSILRNCVPERYLTVPWKNEPVFGWGGSLASHPDDLQMMGFAAARLQREGFEFRVIGDITNIKKTINLDEDPTSPGIVDITEWPNALATLGVGVAPLADTVFNASKSWLKPLEMAAVGVPFVMSPRDEYVAFQRIFHHGAFAKKPIDWYRRLNALLQSSDMREEQSAKGREVAAAWTYELNAHRWLDAWTQAGITDR